MHASAVATREIPQPIRQKFQMLIGRMSPENLSCDGELRESEIARREKQIRNEWKELEKRVGRKVDEDEIDVAQGFNKFAA